MRHRGSRGVRRRKPVVVVGAVAAGLLVAGGIAATRAGAAETPQWPDVPGFSLSDLPGFSGFGDDSDGDGSDGDGSDGDRADGDRADSDDASSGDADSANFDAGGSAAGDSAAGDSGSDASGAGDPARPAGDSGHRLGGADDASSAHRGPAAGDRSRAGDGAGATDHERSDPVAGAAAHAVQERPAAQKAAAAPAGQRPAMALRDAGGSLIAAAKQEVTAADISQSPDAPTQQQILALINGNRRAHGCEGVTLDRRLIEAANGHAADMARHDYFAHESRNGDGAGDRVTEAGYNWRHYGENIARGVDSAYEVVNGWMHSPEHRHNILDCTLHQMGVGVAIAGDGKRTIYWVQDFATPM